MEWRGIRADWHIDYWWLFFGLPSPCDEFLSVEWFRPNTVQLLAFSSLTVMISSTVQLVLVLLEGRCLMAAVSAEAERVR